MRWVFASYLVATGCVGGVTLAPHLNRERELAPAAAEDRFGVVQEKAGTFERQNERSKDVHWYRAWRMAAMVGLDQVEPAKALGEQILQDASMANPPPSQVERLRLFVHELLAEVAVRQGAPVVALEHLERGLKLLPSVDPETRNECDRHLMTMTRLQRISEVALLAQDGARAGAAREDALQAVRRWSKCLSAKDYPGLRAVASLERALSAPVAQAVAGPPSVMAPPPIAPSVSVAPPPPVAPVAPAVPVTPAAPTPTGLAALPLKPESYNVISEAPWAAGLATLQPLLAQGIAKGARVEAAIRTDGGSHALRFYLNGKVVQAADLVPLYRSTVLFFEATRSVNPRIDRVLMVVEGVEVAARRDDIFLLFQEQLDPNGFVARLVRTK